MSYLALVVLIVPACIGLGATLALGPQAWVLPVAKRYGRGLATP